VLREIFTPADVRALPEEALPELAAEIRSVLVQTVSRTGGHLASNLGVVELTIALHRAFESPADTFVFDVSHQIYTHKLLTGRFSGFETLRQSGGVSGFANPAESVHDPFYCGHSSTSVSAALGIAEGKKLQGDQHYTVAVLGDGSLTGGLAYEGLENAGESNAKLIVVLNDNEMSISPNVGGLSRYLSKIRSQPEYRVAKRRIEGFLRLIPGLGKPLASLARAIKRFIKRTFVASTLFEDLGLTYIGPVDGHDFEALEDALESAKIAARPTLVHVRTVKGKGYAFAEAAPTAYHGVAPFDPDLGEPEPPPNAAKPTAPTSFSNAFALSLCRLAEENPQIVTVTAAMSAGTGLTCFEKQFPDRIFDVGIAEAHAVTFAAGLCKQGLRPVVAVYSTFFQRTFDSVLHDVALQGLPVVLCIDRAGFVGEDGVTHHGLFDTAMCNGIPGLEVWSPATYADLDACLQYALTQTEKPVVIRYPRGRESGVKMEQCSIYGALLPYCVSGTGESAIVTYGRLCGEAGEAIQSASAAYKLVALNRIRPISADAIKAVLDCKRVFFFEEGTKHGGIGETFGSLLTQAGYKGKYFLQSVEGFPRHAPIPELLAEYGLDTERIQTITMEAADA
jgi:1-deoxy-D-xylulose-5-phosphate synthase